MLKNLLTLFTALLCATTAINSAAATPPKYLAVKDFKRCLATQTIETYQAWCMPAKKLANCPTASWKQLKALTATDKLPDCPSGPGTATAAPSEQ